MTTPDGEPMRGGEDTTEPTDEEPTTTTTGTELIMLSEQFTSSPRGARLARRLAVRRMGEWGWPPESDTSCIVALLVGEFAANAVRHGFVPGRNFHLHLGFEPQKCLVRIEVSDASPAQPPTSPPPSSPDDESGRGLVLVDVLAARWGAASRDPVGKTVWAEVASVMPNLAPDQADAVRGAGVQQRTSSQH